MTHQDAIARLAVYEAALRYYAQSAAVGVVRHIGGRHYLISDDGDIARWALNWKPERKEAAQ